jgi:Kef-type K+ transport system membrane component KefB
MGERENGWSVALLAATASDLIGLHAIFGAFLAGCAFPRRGRLSEQAGLSDSEA